MNIYAIISIIEAILKLAVAFFLSYDVSFFFNYGFSFKKLELDKKEILLHGQYLQQS